jgi:serine protease Do
MRAAEHTSARASCLALALLSAGAVSVAQAQQRGAQPPAPQDTVIPFPQEIGTLRPGVIHMGRLQPGDWTMGNDPTYADVWHFEGQAGQRVQIEMRSRDLDSYLQLLDAAGAYIAENHGGAGGRNARIVATLRQSGRYQVVANDYYDAPRSGQYTIQLVILSGAR